MTQVPENNSGNDFIRGLATNPCINGITKTDALEIKKIPELDERVTALEQGGSGGNENWIITTNVDDIFEIDENEVIRFKNDTFVKAFISTFTLSNYYIKGSILADDKSLNYCKVAPAAVTNTNIVLNIDSLVVNFGEDIDESDNNILYGFYEFNYGSITFNPSVTSSDITNEYDDLVVMNNEPIPVFPPVKRKGIVFYIKSSDVQPNEPSEPVISGGK